MANEDVKGLLEQSIETTSKALTLLNAPAPDNLPIITTSAELDTALEGAAPILKVSTDLVYNPPLRIRRPVTLISDTFETRQRVPMTVDEPAPRFLQGIRWDAEHVGLLGLEVRHTPGVTNDLVQGYGNFASLERLRVLGDPIQGNKRGVHFHCGSWSMARCYVDHIKRVGQDSQAVYQQQMTPPYGGLIDECYLSAAGEVVMIGGGDPPDETQVPRNIKIQHSKLTRPRAWYTEGWQIKNALELKNCIGFTIADSDLEGAGTSEGQGAYLIVLTPRNQNGTAPYTTVQDVLIERVRGTLASGVINMIGYDPTIGKPSGPLANVVVRECRFTEIDPQGITKMRAAGGSGRLFYMDRGPQKVTLEAITVEGQNIGALTYMEHEPPTGLVLRNLKLPASKYGFHTPMGGTVAALRLYAPDATVELASATDVGATAV